MLVNSLVQIRFTVFLFAINGVDTLFNYEGFPVRSFLLLLRFLFILDDTELIFFLYAIFFTKKWLNYIVPDLKEINPTI